MNKKMKKKIEELVTMSIPLIFTVGMFLYWLAFGY